ncbi:MAG: hypothetical protein AAGG46_12175, partial [Planctomycetota bacterium]
ATGTVNNAEATAFEVPDAWNFGDLDGDGTANENPGEVFVAGSINRPENLGFDAYVGLTGSGLLEITAGGRAEIQDAVIVGYGPQASGEVIVSGSGSYLGQYGGVNPVSATTTYAQPAISQMVIGGFGTGVMRITDGGLVQAFRGAAIGVTQSGGEQIGPDSDDFDRGGRGTVIVDGAGSQWDIFVSDGAAGASTASDTSDSGLAIGEFLVNALIPADYDVDSGSGVLTISNGGRVRVLDNDEGNDDGDLRIGRFGQVVLDNGTLEVQDEIFTDGVIRGSGDILAGRIIMRELNEVIVEGGERLSIRTDEVGTDTSIGNPVLATFNGGINNYFAVNLGKIEVLGDEANGPAVFEVLRADDPTTPTLPATTEVRFWNASRTVG